MEYVDCSALPLPEKREDCAARWDTCIGDDAGRADACKPMIERCVETVAAPAGEKNHANARLQEACAKVQDVIACRGNCAANQACKNRCNRI